MRLFHVTAICLMVLSGCSKSPGPTDPANTQSPKLTINNNHTASAINDVSFLKSAKRDFAIQFVADASDTCGSVKGEEMPDLKTGQPIKYAADGNISWGTGHFNYVEGFGGVTFINSKAEHTFSCAIFVIC